MYNSPIVPSQVLLSNINTNKFQAPNQSPNPTHRLAENMPNLLRKAKNATISRSRSNASRDSGVSLPASTTSLFSLLRGKAVRKSRNTSRHSSSQTSEASSDTDSVTPRLAVSPMLENDEVSDEEDSPRVIDVDKIARPDPAIYNVKVRHPVADNIKVFFP